MELELSAASLAAASAHARRYTGPNRISMRDLIKLARHCYDRSFAKTADEQEALELVSLATLPARLLREDAPDHIDYMDEFDFTNSFWAAKWFACGLPRVRVRAARAASFAATALPPEHAAAVLPPWPAFLIEVEDAGEILSLPGTDDPCDRLEVLSTGVSGEPTWNIFARSRSGRVLPQLWVPQEEWGAQLSDRGLFGSSPEDASQRLLQVVGRIVLGSCIALTAPDAREVAQHRAASKRFRRRGLPQITDFVLGNDVRVDVRSAIRDYVAGGGSPPTVQSLIRGHWKRQAHGPNASLRRWIQIEPYWRGPEDAPVVVRKHVIE